LGRARPVRHPPARRPRRVRAGSPPLRRRCLRPPRGATAAAAAARPSAPAAPRPRSRGRAARMGVPRAAVAAREVDLMAGWVRVAASADLPEGEMIEIGHKGEPLVIARTSSGLYAFDG